MRRLSGALIGVILAVSACGLQPATAPQPSVTAGVSTPEPAPAGQSATPSRSATAATPADVPKGQQFTLDDRAQFDDGLVIEIAGTVADRAAKTDRGAEATHGEIVIASVRIENNSKKAYDAGSVLIGAKYRNNKDAQIIIDKTEELQSGFKGKIKPKDEHIATVGFAVPWNQLKKVTFIVDPNDDVHETISFTGRVHRA
jgi:hypothetical protein